MRKSNLSNRVIVVLLSLVMLVLSIGYSAFTMNISRNTATSNDPQTENIEKEEIEDYAEIIVLARFTGEREKHEYKGAAGEIYL